MIEAIAKNHFQIHVRAPLAELGQVFTGRFQRLNISPGDAIQPLHGHDLMRAQVGINARYADSRIVVKVPRKLLQVALLIGKVHLAQQRAPQLPDDGDRLVGPDRCRLALDQFGQQLHDLQIRDDPALNAGAPNFHHNTFSAWQNRAIHLRDGGRSDGCLIKFGKQLLQGRPKIFLDDRAC